MCSDISGSKASNFWHRDCIFSDIVSGWIVVANDEDLIFAVFADTDTFNFNNLAFLLRLTFTKLPRSFESFHTTWVKCPVPVVLGSTPNVCCFISSYQASTASFPWTLWFGSELELHPKFKTDNLLESTEHDESLWLNQRIKSTCKNSRYFHRICYHFYVASRTLLRASVNRIWIVYTGSRWKI